MRGKRILTSAKEVSARLRRVRMVSLVGSSVALAAALVSLYPPLKTIAGARHAGRRQEALKLIEKGVRLAGQKGHLGEAILMYEQALKIDPDNAAAENFRGYALYRKGELADAKKALERSVSLAPANPWGHYNYALVLWRSGDRQAAISHMKESVRIAPEMLGEMERDVQFRVIWSSTEAGGTQWP